MNHDESNLSLKVSEYMQRQYPQITYRFDIADMKLTMPQAKRMKQLQGENSRGYSDMFIAFPTKHYHGLFIELKRDVSEVFLKDMKTYRKKTVKKNGVFAYDHIQEQVKFLTKMNKLNYKAVFGFGFENIKNIIDNYIKGNK